MAIFTKIYEILQITFSKKKEELPNLFMVRSTIDFTDYKEFLDELQTNEKKILHNQSAIMAEIEGIKKRMLYLEKRMGIR